jgi:cytochrome c oxidase subunit 4
MSEHEGTSARGLAYTLLVLLLLAGLSLGLRFAQLGSFSFPVALGIAALKALLVAIFFMELLTEKATVRFAFLAGLTLFALMLVLVVADVLTRSTPPLQAPPGTAQRYYG